MAQRRKPVSFYLFLWDYYYLICYTLSSYANSYAYFVSSIKNIMMVFTKLMMIERRMARYKPKYHSY